MTNFPDATSVLSAMITPLCGAGLPLYAAFLLIKESRFALAQDP